MTTLPVRSLVLTLLVVTLVTGTVVAGEHAVPGSGLIDEFDAAGRDGDRPVLALVFLDPPPPTLYTSELPLPDKIDFLRTQSFSIQADVLADMEATDPGAIDLQEGFWIINVMAVSGTPKDLKKLAKKKKVRKIARSGKIRLIDPSQRESGWPAGLTTVWNMLDVGAPNCWADGYTGDGVVIAHLDTGVDTTHPQLAGKFAGYWLDAVNGYAEPYDDHGHGTHTLGTVLGGDGNGPSPYDVGVAPGARWVGAKILDEDGAGSYIQCLKGLQFIAELKSQVDVRAVCGSWSLDSAGNDFLLEACRTLLALEILPVFAVGNDGPGAGTADVPGAYPAVLGVGALGEDGLPTAFSSRGPVSTTEWLDEGAAPLIAGWDGHKPDLAAPGEKILSCDLDGKFSSLSGTSMAAPHVVGAAALLLEKVPNLTVRELASVLLTSVRSVAGAETVPNNAVGYGGLNVRSAMAGVDASGPPPLKGGKVQDGSLALERTRDGLSVRYRATSAAPARLEIFDLAGRRVKTLAVPLTDREGLVVWRGRDTAGRPVRSGVYLVRLSDGERTLTRKTTWIR